MKTREIKRAFAETPSGEIHYRVAGEGFPVLMLHQTPRSSDEFLDVIPAFSEHFKVIAMDTIGYGDSYKHLSATTTLEDLANAAVQLMDAIGIERAHLVGHHTGSTIAIEIAASHPERVGKLVLSAAPYIDENRSREIMTRPSVDKVDVKEDGSHLTEMWQIRMKFYPKNRPDLLTRFVTDALKAKENIELGHLLVARYRVPPKLPLIQAQTLALCGTDDPYCFPDLHKIAKGIKNCQSVEVPGGMVPMVDQMPETFSKIVIDFLRA
jgi:pimeloyl-ACP methyl ester carboxylesterase